MVYRLINSLGSYILLKKETVYFPSAKRLLDNSREYLDVGLFTGRNCCSQIQDFGTYLELKNF